MKKILILFFIFICFNSFADSQTDESILINNKIPLSMVYIHSGEFEENKIQNTSEPSPERNNIELTYDFLIGKHEITQAQWLEVMGEYYSDDVNNIAIYSDMGYDLMFAPCNVKESALEDNLPVHGISLVEAVEFCNKLSIIQGLEPCYKKNENGYYIWDIKADGYRLPTAAEWDYAIECGTNKEQNLNRKLEIEEEEEDDDENIPNGWGLYNIVGNVWELNSDEMPENECFINSETNDIIDPYNKSEQENLRDIYGRIVVSETNIGIHGMTMNVLDNHRYLRVGFRIARTVFKDK